MYFRLNFPFILTTSNLHNISTYCYNCATELTSKLCTYILIHKSKKNFHKNYKKNIKNTNKEYRMILNHTLQLCAYINIPIGA